MYATCYPGHRCRQTGEGHPIIDVRIRPITENLAMFMKHNEHRTGEGFCQMYVDDYLNAVTKGFEIYSEVSSLNF